MRPTHALRRLIAEYMTRPGAVPNGSPKSRFVTSGLRTAGSAAPQTRANILSDVADVLDCDAQDLDFLYSEFEDDAETRLSVPDYRDALKAS